MRADAAPAGLGPGSGGDGGGASVVVGGLGARFHWSRVVFDGVDVRDHPEGVRFPCCQRKPLAGATVTGRLMSGLVHGHMMCKTASGFPGNCENVLVVDRMIAPDY